MEGLEGRALLAPVLKLVTDINSKPGGIDVGGTSIVEVNGVGYFSSPTGGTGNELWKSDGTTAGSGLVKDIVPGEAGSYPQGLTNFRGELFFFANATQLWKTDGTAEGTGIVKDLGSEGERFPAMLGSVNGVLYFGTSDVSGGGALWRSDGSGEGTFIIKNVFAGDNSQPGDSANVDGVLFFRGTSTATSGDDELWKSDGTIEGTTIVKDIYPGDTGSSPRDLVNINGTLFFAANDGIIGEELWKSNGTGDGTEHVRDIHVGANDSAPRELTNLNGQLIFIAEDEATGEELWISGGTGQSTMRLKDIRSGPDDSRPRYLTNAEGTLYFRAAETPGQYELWKTDGTAAGTVLVEDATGAAVSSPRYMASVDGTLYFGSFRPETGYELWKSDGSAQGTMLVKDIIPGPEGGYPKYTSSVNGKLFFEAGQFPDGHLWTSEGTIESTGAVLRQGGATMSALGFTPLMEIGDVAYFAATDGELGTELWRSDGTAAGTRLVKDLREGPSSGLSFFGADFTNVNGTLFFNAFDAAPGTGLWQSDGTTQGTRLVTDSEGASIGAYGLVDFGGTLFFTARSGFELGLWKYDGTEASMVVALLPDSFPRDLTHVDGTLFFVLTSYFTQSAELWKSDGTSEGTTFVKELPTGDVLSLIDVNGMLFFVVYDGFSGYQLWKSDGSAEGTEMVHDLTSPGTDFPVVNVNGTLFFAANGDTGDPALWKTDGTTTTLVQPFFNLSELENVNGRLLFSATDSSGFSGLWTSDGTSEGTVLVKEVLAPAIYLSNVGGTLYFRVLGTDGSELWRSDGTPDGTNEVTSVPRGKFSPVPREMLSLAGRVVFRADDGISGRELWALGKRTPWHNVAKPMDVDGDTKVAAGDALEVINYINAFGSQEVAEDAEMGAKFYDTTGDNHVAPEDALAVINRINAGEGEAEGPIADFELRIADFAAAFSAVDELMAAVGESGSQSRRGRRAW